MDNDIGFENLANAIITQAAVDYRREYDILQVRPDDPGARARIAKLKKFFYSDYYSILTKVDPDYLIEQIEATPFVELRRKTRCYSYTGESRGVERKVSL